MLDIIIVVCCILSGFALGKYFEKGINEKGGFFRDVTRYADCLKENVVGRQLELKEFNREFSKTCGKPFAEYLEKGKTKIKLNKTQKDCLSSFFGNLDCASSQALVRHLEYYGKILADECKNVAEREVSKASVYGKLGTLLGAMIGILLV